MFFGFSSLFFVYSKDQTETMSDAQKASIEILRHELATVLQQNPAPSSGFGTLLSYIGPIDSHGLDHLLCLTQQSTGTIGSRNAMKRVCNVLIECLQNVMRHGLVNAKGLTQLYLSIESTPVGFQVHCGNLVDGHTRELLTDKLSQINGLSPAEIRKAYIETLCHGEMTEKGGAGLGLLSMAKKATGPIEYRFEDKGREGELFTVTITVTH